MSRLDDLADELQGGRITPPDDPELENACPFLWDYLTVDRWKDGTARLLPRITIDRVPGGYKVCLQDDGLWVKKTVIVHTLAGIPEALEKGLLDAQLPFEPFKSFRNKQGPKVPEGEKRPGQRRKK